MKNWIFLVSALVIIFSCTKENLKTTVDQNGTLEFRSAEKVDICHQSADGKWHVINVSVNAIPAHEKRGDVVLIDADNDGWVEAENECVPGGDCDDSDPTVNPGVKEVCGDGIDNNCDGEVDEGCCPMYTFEEIIAISEQITSSFLPCCGDQWGFRWSGGCNFGVDVDDRWGCGPACGTCVRRGSLTVEEALNCKEIILRVAEVLGIDPAAVQPPNGEVQVGL